MPNNDELKAEIRALTEQTRKLRQELQEFIRPDADALNKGEPIWPKNGRANERPRRRASKKR